MNDLLWIFVSSAIINNFTLAYFLGLCPFFGVSKKIDTAFRLGLADVFVLVMTSIFTTLLNKYILKDAPYLSLMTYIVVIACAVQFVEMVIKKLSPALFNALGIYLPLITTNCAILALALFQTSREYTFLQGIAFAVGSGVGLTMALVLMAGLREETELADIPDVLQGFGMAFLIAGILSMAFMGFAGLFSGA